MATIVGDVTGLRQRHQPKIYHIFERMKGGGGGWGGRLFEARRLLTFSLYRMGVYSRCAGIRGWVLIIIK